MSILKIQTGKTNPILRNKAKEVKTIDKKIKTLIKDMKETLIASDGLGIAAPQVGEGLRVILATLNYDTNSQLTIAMINPEITYFSSECEAKEEGCLSVPGVWGAVNRSKKIIVTYTDISGKRISLELDGLNAREIQHEVDHLNGVLFTDIMEAKVSYSANS